jgi:PAS domain S-box-containing protein
MLQRILRWGPRAVLIRAAILIAIIAVTDWQVEFNATLGFLYIFPLVLLGAVLDRWQLLLAALFCTFLSDRLDPFPFDQELARDTLIFLALATTGLLSRDVTSGYRMVAKEAVARRAAEEQLEFLIQSSPAAVLTMTPEGEILLANPAAHRLLGVPAGLLSGRRITRYIPALGSVPSIEETANMFRTEMQTRGQREGGEVFLADVFFSTYRTAAGPRLAAFLVDSSERLRVHEETSLQQLLTGSRILVAAMSHEVRNVCGAIAVMHENLTREGALNGNQDFEALGSLVQTLAKIASLDLKQRTVDADPGPIDLHEVLADLRIVVEQSCEESEIQLVMKIPENLPLVHGDRHSLMQVLLNLTRNSQRALESASRKVLEISVSANDHEVSIRVTDSGPGIPAGQKLFEPLQKGAEATGLGLYLSRAFMRSFRGDLRHDAARPGCSFVLELAAAAEFEEDSSMVEHAPDPSPVA